MEEKHNIINRSLLETNRLIDIIVLYRDILGLSQILIIEAGT